MMNEAQAAAYLAGIIDGEGWVVAKPAKFIGIANTDWDIVEATMECCATLGLRHRVNVSNKAQRRGRSTCWQVTIGGKETLERVQQIVPIRCRRKQVRLAEAIASFHKTPRPPREWLEQKYVIEGLSLQQIAELWGKKSATSAFHWMEFYGIPCRTLSESAVNRRRKEAAGHG
jgi:hypothetical protein